MGQNLAWNLKLGFPKMFRAPSIRLFSGEWVGNHGPNPNPFVKSKA